MDRSTTEASDSMEEESKKLNDLKEKKIALALASAMAKDPQYADEIAQLVIDWCKKAKESGYYPIDNKELDFDTK